MAELGRELVVAVQGGRQMMVCEGLHNWKRMEGPEAESVA